jgi:membrane protein implicated in regulation of membrane protease activity
VSIPAEIAIWGVTAIVSAALAGIVAGIKNRDYSFWIAITFLLPPVLLILVLLPRLKERRMQPPVSEEEEADAPER